MTTSSKRPVWALIDKATNHIRMAPDGCLAIFDTREAARRVAKRTTNVRLVRCSALTLHK